MEVNLPSNCYSYLGFVSLSSQSLVFLVLVSLVLLQYSCCATCWGCNKENVAMPYKQLTGQLSWHTLKYTLNFSGASLDPNSPYLLQTLLFGFCSLSLPTPTLAAYFNDIYRYLFSHLEKSFASLCSIVIWAIIWSYKTHFPYIQQERTLLKHQFPYHRQKAVNGSIRFAINYYSTLKVLESYKWSWSNNV